MHCPLFFLFLINGIILQISFIPTASGTIQHHPPKLYYLPKTKDLKKEFFSPCWILERFKFLKAAFILLCLPTIQYNVWFWCFFRFFDFSSMRLLPYSEIMRSSRWCWSTIRNHAGLSSPSYITFSSTPFRIAIVFTV